MKCVNCGAQIGLDVEKCPYCSTVNKIAKKRKAKLLRLKNKNEAYEKKLLESSKEVMWYRLHKIINIILAVAVFVVMILPVAWPYVEKVGASIVQIKEIAIGTDVELNSQMEQLKAYYDSGKYVSLYCYLPTIDEEHNPELLEHSDMEHFWERYVNAQLYFMQAYDSFLETGYYDTQDLKLCIGYCCMTLRYKYLAENDVIKAEPLKEDIHFLLEGALKVPREMFENYTGNYDVLEDEIIKYVLEVLPNE